MSGDAAVKPRRRWRVLALSVRGLLILTAILAIVMGRLASRAEAQRRAVKLMEAEGCVGYADEPTHVGSLCWAPEHKIPGPEWLRNLVGEDYFRTVNRVEFQWSGMNEDIDRYDPISEEAMWSLLELPGLTTLRIDHRIVTDEQLEIVGNLSSLEKVEISDCRGFHSNALDSIGRLRKLRELSLFLDEVPDGFLKCLASTKTLKEVALGDGLSGSGLGHLRELPRLQNLFLMSSRLNDAGMVELGRLRYLRDLYVGRSPNVTDRGLGGIASLPSLERLSLSQFDQITDEGISQLDNLGSLQELDLDHLDILGLKLDALSNIKGLHTLRLVDTPISDEGFLAVARLPSLKHLSTIRLAVTPEGIAKFQAIRPDLAEIR